MMFRLCFLFILFLYPCNGKNLECNIPDSEKLDCGIKNASQDTCEAAGCCWQSFQTENRSSKVIPRCFQAVKQNPCSNINWSASDPGFTRSNQTTMYYLFMINMNIEHSGAVCAAPDIETPDGPYYYHWMRVAALSMKAWMDINYNIYDKVESRLVAYAAWVEKVQQKADPNGIDVRIEPKFTITDGEPYAGESCRPQTDGPALRAMAMSKWGMILKKNGNDTSAVWNMVKFDLDWVMENWREESCDIWEEVRSDDFLFNRMAYIYSLNVAADFGDMLGEETGMYRTLAEEIKEATQSHWKDGFLYESTNRPYDAAVLHAIATFGEYLFPPSSNEAAATISVLVDAFCDEYPINQEDIADGKPGLLIGRYPGDTYAGGNPWQLLTAALGELFYLGAQATFKDVQQKGDFSLKYSEHKEWIKLLRLKEGSTAKDLARAQVEAGDAVMTSLSSHVTDGGGQIYEQIDKYTGVQTSALGLTWSYANILHALHIRSQIDPALGISAWPSED